MKKMIFFLVPMAMAAGFCLLFNPQRPNIGKGMH